MHADGEPGDEQQPEPVRGHRVEEEGDARRDVVERLVAPHRLGDPERDGDGEREHERRYRRG